jgi:hypothetical protein
MLPLRPCCAVRWFRIGPQGSNVGGHRRRLTELRLPGAQVFDRSIAGAGGEA